MTGCVAVHMQQMRIFTVAVCYTLVMYVMRWKWGAALLNEQNKGSGEIRTRVAGVRILSAGHYTTEPKVGLSRDRTKDLQMT